MLGECLGALSLGIWLYLLVGRGGFWRVRPEPVPSGPVPSKSVAVVIPARDEAATIGRTVASLRAQQYAGRLDIFVVDDHSSDDTAQLAAGDRVTVLNADPLPPGWTGKLWAVGCGLRRAALAEPDYYLLTDADIVHACGNVAALVARAEAGRLDMVSLMVKLHCETLAERTLIPAFLFFFLKLYPPAWTAQPRAQTAGAAGGCILIRPAALERIGGVASIRGELIDDCALARRVKQGGPIWMGVTESTVSIRSYETFGEIGRMISRSAFTQLRHSSALLAGTVVGLLLTYVAPPLLAFFGTTHWAQALGGAAWLLMAIAFLPALRLYRRSTAWAPLLPLAAVFYLGATLHSAYAYWTGKGGLWKGRIQDRGL